MIKDGKPVYPSSAFNVGLVRYLISQGVMVIAARSVDFWEKALGDDFHKCLQLRNPQNITISQGNLPDVWEAIVDKLKN